MLPNIEVIVGTYEEFLLGYKLESKDGKPVLTQSFADKSHLGAIKCLAVRDNWIATGSTDERIIVYDMRTRKQAEMVIAHGGTINALVFAPDSTQLFSGGGDGHMIATHTSNWRTTASWKKAHGGSALTHISCHPSGKLALSLGTDLILRTWNLVKGRVAYKSNLKSRSSLGRVADCLAWSPNGDYFTLTGQRVVEIWSIQNADVVKSQKTTSKPISLCWVNDETCIIGLEDGQLLWMTLKEGEKEVIVEAHSVRVKAMAILEKTLVTASSAGEIKVWQINVDEKKLTEISVTNIGCRPTCLGILDLEKFNTSFKVVAEDTKADMSNVVKKPKPARGVVTIEYENEHSEVEDSHNSKGNITELKNESEPESDDGSDKDVEDESDDSESNERIVESSEDEKPMKSKKRKLIQQPINTNTKKSKTSKTSNFNKKNLKPQRGNFKQKNK